jgi:hypothetical protein
MNSNQFPTSNVVRASRLKLRVNLNNKDDRFEDADFKSQVESNPESANESDESFMDPEAIASRVKPRGYKGMREP